MGHAISGGPYVFTSFSGATGSEFVDGLAAALQAANWELLESIDGGYRLRGRSPQADGLRGAFAIAQALNITSSGRAQRVNALLDRLGLAVKAPAVSPESVMEHMATDKKHALGRLSWILPTETGVVVRSDVPAEAVAAGLAAALRLAPIHKTVEASIRP